MLGSSPSVDLSMTKSEVELSQLLRLMMDDSQDISDQATHLLPTYAAAWDLMVNNSKGAASDNKGAAAGSVNDPGLKRKK